MKVCVLGAAGGIGQPLSLLLKNQLPNGTLLSLYDVNPVIMGIVKDLTHIPTDIEVVGYCSDNIKLAIQDSEIILISAGVARKIGMKRSDLLNINGKIICTLVQQILLYAPEAFLGIITNPINTIVPIAVNMMKKVNMHSKNKIFGITTLDVIRSIFFVSKFKNINPKEINVTVIGGHSGSTIIPLLSKLSNLNFSDSELEYLINKIQNSGTEIVEAKINTGSATLSMAYAAVKFCMSLIHAINGKKDIVECAYIESNCKYARFFSYPIQLSAHGIEKILPIEPISFLENNKIKDMLPILHADIKLADDFFYY